MLHQRILDLPLLYFRVQPQEIESIGILQRLYSQIGMWCRQAMLKIGDRLALAVEQAGFYMDVQHIARPTMLNGSTRICQPLGRILEALEQYQVMAPGQLCSSLLHNLDVGPSLGKGPHVFEVARRKTLQVRESRMQIVCQPIYHLRAPALVGLARENIAADLPVQSDQFPIDS